MRSDANCDTDLLHGLSLIDIIKKKARKTNPALRNKSCTLRLFPVFFFLLLLLLLLLLPSDSASASSSSSSGSYDSSYKEEEEEEEGEALQVSHFKFCE